MMYRIGIDLGGTYIKTGITDEEYNIIAQSSVKTDVMSGAENIINKISEQIRLLTKENSIDKSQIAGIGISCPGIIDSKSGVVLYSNNFNWNNYHLKEKLQNLLGVKVKVKNDALCAVIGEMKAGNAKGLKNVVLLTLGTGVGSGIAVDGRVFEGGGDGGIAGHNVIVKNGRQCTCGRKGCLEAYASATALISETKKCLKEHPNSKIKDLCGGDEELINGKTAFDAAKLGDKDAEKVVFDYIDSLANGIANLINLFRPEAVLLSGGICNEGDNLLKPLNEKVKGNCFAGDILNIPKVEIAGLKNTAGIIGASALIEMECE